MKKLLILIIILLAAYFALDKFYPQILQKIPIVKQETMGGIESNINPIKTYLSQKNFAQLNNYMADRVKHEIGSSDAKGIISKQQAIELIKEELVKSYNFIDISRDIILQLKSDYVSGLSESECIAGIFGYTSSKDHSALAVCVESNRITSLYIIRNYISSLGQVETSSWKTYTNAQYGFEINLPPYWEGYKTDMRKLTDGGTSIGFNFPYTFNTTKTYYDHALQIIVYPISVWPSVQFSDNSKPPKLAENSKYVYSYAIGQDLGGDSELEMVGKDVTQILSTFKLISPTLTPISKDETALWNLYTYSSLESGILPNITFKYPSLFGSNPTSISSRNTNRPENISDDWGGFAEFNPAGTFGDRGLRVEFFKRTNSEISFESYVTKYITTSGWTSPKYFQAGNHRVARLRFVSSSHYDADVGWYFVELSNKSILAISTSGDKKYLFDDDQNGNSTRDKIISTLLIAQ